MSRKKKKSWRNRCATWNIHYYGDGHKENTCSSEGQLWIMSKYTEMNRTRCRLENRGGSPASTAGRLQPCWQNQNQTTISGKLNEDHRKTDHCKSRCVFSPDQKNMGNRMSSENILSHLDILYSWSLNSKNSRGSSSFVVPFYAKASSAWREVREITKVFQEKNTKLSKKW